MSVGLDFATVVSPKAGGVICWHAHTLCDWHSLLLKEH